MSSKYLFDEIFRMVLEYMQRRSDLPEEEFNEIIDKLEPDMSTKFKTIFDVAEERGSARKEAEANEARAEANQAKAEANEAKGNMEKAVIKLIQTNALTDSQIADVFQIEIDFVKNLRLTIKPIFKKKK